MDEGAIVEFLTHLEKERDLSSHTIAAYRRDLAAFEAFLRRFGILAAGEEQAVDFGLPLFGD